MEVLVYYGTTPKCQCKKGKGSWDPPEVIAKETGRLWHKALVGSLPGQVTYPQFRPSVLRSWRRCKEDLQDCSGETGGTEWRKTRGLACFGWAKWRPKGLCTGQGKGRGKRWCQGQQEGKYQQKAIPITGTSQFCAALLLALVRIRIRFRSQNLGSRDVQEAPWNTFKLQVLGASENQVTSLVPSSNSPTIWS